jgi:hypothetical protein
MTDSKGERRQDPRLKVRCLVSYRQIQGGKARPKTTAAKTINLSASGLCLLSPEPVIPDTHLALEVGLEGEPSPVVAVGRVVWCDQDAESYRIGICFTWLREEDRKALDVIADFVESRLRP